MSFFINPVHILVGSFLFMVSIPLAAFAFWTTWFAFSVLAARLVYVYLQMTWETTRYVLWDRWVPGQYIESPPVSRRPSRPVTPSGRSPARSSISPSSRGASSTRRRTDSTSSAGPRVAFSGAVLLEPSHKNALERDFEGLGGWRIQDDGRDTTNENAWDSLNARLELQDHHQLQRHHYRSHTHAGSFANSYNFASPPVRLGARSGPHSPGPLTTGATLSPHSPRSRTPTRVRAGPLKTLERQDSYFPLVDSTHIRNIAA
ncbi:hypothetical protein BKA67DRAFT_529790 [Truncatella angustata]|uniref:Uncharacterized protein n=1 Tax=Truncatella angustata TaxID=152316 RepID=A0A9P9A3V0_9PEZI|nr:uncharacterized protein BKA67DRAFT_529790 [Truncatella angustata]KAH6659645.1 hypothetical protein BKA67DRAFT_529790 [Truncatella angustata]KAH8201257.1 hypothetical protein TruAng_004574 [Truncatella angustata]